ncbi:MAG: hypothetical protein PHP70_04780 [Gallionella sp.]|nr:hypothetical protein [Gallionella sp.]
MKNKMLLAFTVLAVLSFEAQGEEASKRAAKAEVSFKNDVRPLLYDHCLNCHSPGGKGYNKSGLDMTTYESLMKGTKFGPVVKPGDPETSTFVMLLEGRANPALRMPAGINGSLYRQHITTLRTWVHQGAKNN